MLLLLLFLLCKYQMRVVGMVDNPSVANYNDDIVTNSIPSCIMYDSISFCLFHVFRCYKHFCYPGDEDKSRGKVAVVCVGSLILHSDKKPCLSHLSHSFSFLVPPNDGTNGTSQLTITTILTRVNPRNGGIHFKSSQ
mmetsp:Transcript_29510/g.45211  ORF Transcript_29510/g.45211 Transcript_29510/m.45211 type:complete len:137 (+) Transcript_29510:49-459(+)